MRVNLDVNLVKEIYLFDISMHGDIKYGLRTFPLPNFWKTSFLIFQTKYVLLYLKEIVIVIVHQRLISNHMLSY